MDVAFSSRVIYRDEAGRFKAALTEAATKTVEEAINRGADLSRGFAPAGHKPDPRTVPLKASISAHMVSATQGYWQSSARHALPIEFGASGHSIPGDVSFFWEKAGRMWIPYSPDGPPWLHETINHPGNAAQPFLRPAYKIITSELMDIARRNYPG